MPIDIARIKGETHDDKLLPALTFERIKLVHLVERSIEEMLLCFGGTHHEGWVCHIGVYLLYDKVFRTLTLVLVGTFASHFFLPFLLTFQVVLVTLTDILHN